MNLDGLEIGKDATVLSVDCEEPQLRQHILDMGLTPGTEVTMVKAAPMGDPLQISLRGYELTMRAADAARIAVGQVHDTDAVPRENPQLGRGAHPSLGEGSAKGESAEKTYRWRSVGKPAPKGAPLSLALAGNQNCGKTTLFNQLTGSNQHVGNFPGVTVDRKDGQIRSHPEATVTDLPGIYSLSPYTGEEVVSREFILREKPDAIIDILDATNIERNLYLTLQLMELDVPMVIALNMMDEVAENGGTIDVNGLESALGVPVVPISAARGEGIDELVDHAIHVARNHDHPGRLDFCAADAADGGALHRCIHAVAHLVDDHAAAAGIPVRFAATKLVEEDHLVAQALALDANELHALDHLVSQMEGESGVDRQAALADMRFSFIEDVCSRYVVKPRESREHARSRAIDRVLTGRRTAIPVFVAIMAVVFWLTFSVIGSFLSDLLAAGVDAVGSVVGSFLEAAGVNPVVRSLVMDGVFGGVGSVLSFMPVIVVLFIFLSLLEDSGYMARVAFVMDRPLRRLGLSGRSFVPMLVGFGCSVPAIMSTRTLPSDHDRKMTALLVPYMSCSAKVPVFTLLSAMFFGPWAGLAVVGLYLLGMVVGVLMAHVLNHTAFRGDPVPFVMELPNYRIPTARTTLLLAWDKAKDFVTRAFSVIFVATIVVWFMQTFDVRFNVVADASQSMLAMLGGAIAPVFAPLGFGSWETSTALVTGFVAKESVVATLTVLGMGALTPLTAFTFLVFTLLYTPCVAAIAAVRNELGWRYAAYVVCVQCGVAWLVAFAVHGLGVLLGLA